MTSKHTPGQTPGPWKHGLASDYRGEICTRWWISADCEAGTRARPHVATAYISEADAELIAAAPETAAERDTLQQWVHDLQSGMFINCVYCGYNYGPQDEVPATMADALTEHIEQCSKHPMSALKTERDSLKAINAELVETIETLRNERRYSS